ncbi:MAG: ArsR/SmtB family transcription factor [Candidatus Dormibacteria bacterium]
MSSAATVRDLKAHFIGLANPTRLAIISLLVDQELSAAAIARELKLSQPLLSWHLRVMRKAGLIETRRRGREISCGIDRGSIRVLQERFNEFINMAGPGTSPVSRLQPISEKLSKETVNAI